MRGGGIVAERGRVYVRRLVRSRHRPVRFVPIEGCAGGGGAPPPLAEKRTD